jgi:hypothetical protein
VQLLGSIVSPFSILKGADKLLSRVAELLQYLCVYFGDVSSAFVCHVLIRSFDFYSVDFLRVPYILNTSPLLDM